MACNLLALYGVVVGLDGFLRYIADIISKIISIKIITTEHTLPLFSATIFDSGPTLVLLVNLHLADLLGQY